MLSSSTISLLSLNSMNVGFRLVFHIPRPMWRHDSVTGDTRDISLRELLSLNIVMSSCKDSAREV